MRKYHNLSKLDRILLPFILFNNDFSIINVLKRATQSISSMLFELDKYQKNTFMKLIYYFLFSLLSLLIYPFVLIIAILSTVIVSVANSLVALLVVIGLGLFYGILPFFIKTKNNVLIKEEKEKPQFKGYHKLKTPMLISISLLKKNGYYFRHTGLAPWVKLKELSEEKETHILNKLALAFASIIAVLLYASIFFVLTDLVVSVFLIIVGFLSGTLWLLINIAVNFFNEVDEEGDEVMTHHPNFNHEGPNLNREFKEIIEPEIVEEPSTQYHESEEE